MSATMDSTRIAYLRTAFDEREIEDSVDVIRRIESVIGRHFSIEYSDRAVIVRWDQRPPGCWPFTVQFRMPGGGMAAELIRYDICRPPPDAGKRRPTDDR